MGNIVTPQEVVNFLRIPDDDGNVVQVSENSDPSLGILDIIIAGIEGTWDDETHHSWGHLSTTTETYDLPADYEFGRGIPIHLAHRSVATIDSEEGDLVELWDGQDWSDITNEPDRFRQVEAIGKLYMRSLVYSLFREDRVRITYRYGTPKAEVPAGVKFAILGRCASKLVESSFAMTTIQSGQDRGIGISEAVRLWKEEYDLAVGRWADVQVVQY